MEFGLLLVLVFFVRASNTKVREIPIKWWIFLTDSSDTDGVSCEMEVVVVILIVEDEPAVLYICKTVLERLGYRILTASSSEEAIDIARHEKEIRLLLTDFTLPRINGRELVHAIRRLHPEVQVFYLSGDLPAAIGVDPEEYIGKPFTFPELVAKVEDALAGVPVFEEDNEEKEVS